ncbi:MAG: ATP-binding protein [Pirellulaceae bacterium]|nr:ATP-binding protein [Pirellulaceae bacterium]
MIRRRIFISSVQKELASERAGLRDYIHADPLLRRFFDLFLFEDLPAADRRADSVYLDEVRNCDIYLGLFAKEYGLEDGQGISPTEHEFNAATDAGKLRLIYVKGASDQAKHPKMLSFISRAGNELIRRRFEDLDTLKPAVYASLVDYLVQEHLISTGPFDASPCMKSSINDLDTDAMIAFIRQARYARNFPLTEATAPEDLLAHLNLAEDGYPTNAAILLFGKDPQHFFPTSEIKCAHFHGIEVAKPIPSYQTYKGRVFQLVDSAVDFVMSKIAAQVGTRSESAQAPVTYEIPRDVVAEAIVNAVAHRDYTSNGSVQVMLFSDRLEVTNPGELPRSLTLEALRHPHNSVPHNPLIAESLYLTQYIERMGTGTGDMIRLCREAGLAEPEYSIRGGFVTTIWRETKKTSGGNDKTEGKTTGKTEGKTEEKTTGKRLSKTARAIVDLMRKQPEITIPELAERLKRSISAIEKQVRQLRDDEMIARIGPAKGGHWEVLK